MNNLYLPAKFWSTVLASLDAKTEVLCEQVGFGEVTLTLKVHRGKITEVYFADEMRVRGLLEKIEEETTKEQDLSLAKDKGKPAGGNTK